MDSNEEPMDQIRQNNGEEQKEGEEEDAAAVPSGASSDYFDNHLSAFNGDYHSLLKRDQGDHAEEKVEEEDVDIVEVPVLQDLSPFVPPTQRADAPLASIINPQLEMIDPRLFFSDYKPNEILRFSRLFASNIKSSSRADIWWLAKTFQKHKPKSTETKEKDGQATNGETPPIKKIKLQIAPNPPADQLGVDQHMLFLNASSDLAANQRAGGMVAIGDDSFENMIAPWRNGPAKLWYDRMNVPQTSDKVDYGFKVNQTNPKSFAPQLMKLSLDRAREIDSDLPIITQEDLLPVNLLRWEDNIIYDGEDVRQKVLDDLRSGAAPACGWVPTQYTRTYEQYMFAVKSGAFEQMFEKRGPAGVPPISLIPDPNVQLEPTSSHSIFPPDNNDVHNCEWEKDIIWDAENMPYLPEPRVLALDFEDEPLIFGMPADRKDDYDPMTAQLNRKEAQFTKKSKMILGQVQQRQKQEAEEQMENNQQLTNKDAFNLSNDDYYIPKAIAKSATTNTSSLIQHSIPALNIHRTFFPTHLTPFKLRHWHRLPLSKRVLRYVGGVNKFQSVHILTQHIKKVEEQREKIKLADGGGDFFFMRDVNDLSGRDGQLLIVEYSEEHPPLLSQPGMASRVKNYYKRKTGKDVEPAFELGELAFSHNVPFLGQLHPGQALQSIENMLYRAPIYAHQPKETDFLLIRCKGNWYIRRCPSLYLAGQQCPLIEVPSPNSKRATVFVRDFLLAFIFRLFWASEHTPRRLKMEDIKNAFPHYAESSVRKRLKQCSEFKRLGTGPDQNYWVLKPDYRLPSKEEVLAMVTPEMCCAQYSMLAAEQRLKDAGYGEKYFFAQENEDASDDEITIEDEVKCAPWSTTRCFISAMRGKCLLDQTGIADPTGCGQGFSYVKVTQKPQKDEATSMPKRLVTGTNADLRKLPLKEAKEICREYGVKEEEISALSRWEIIDVIRTLSTQAAKAKANSSDNELSGMARFARGNIRYNMADMQEKYKKHCQHIFELQNQSLANPEELSTDEGSSADDSDNEDMVSKLEDMLQAHRGKKVIPTSEKARLEFENEERERERLKRIMHGDASKSNVDKSKEATAEEKKSVSKIGEDLAASASKIAGLRANEKLKIHRTIKNEDGTSSTRVEVVTRPQLIEAYKNIRQTRDETFIHVYAQMDEQYKEERRKEKRRIQDQLRRIKRNEQRQQQKDKPDKEKKPVFIKPSLLKMRCSACHGTGHMKTNKNCPLFGKDPLPPPQSPNSEEQTGEESVKELGELTSVEGTKLIISRKVLKAQKAAEKLMTSSPLPPDMDETSQASVASSGASRGKSEPFDDDITEAELIASIKSDYARKLAAQPLLSTTSQQSASSSSSNRRRLSKDVDEDYLSGPAKSVHRMRADPKVTMSSMLMDIVNELKTVPGSEHLLMPVNARLVPDYYTIIKEPMDLNRIKEKVATYKYELRKDFLLDVRKMLDNSRLYNGDNSVITEAARQIFELAGKRILEKDETFMKLEKQINPLLDDNDAVGFSYILTDIVQKCKNIPKSALFHNKVDQRKIPHYYERISRPMDLGTIEENAKQKKYKTVAEFRADIEQIVENSRQFNGPQSLYTLKAQEISDLANMLLREKSEQLAELEANITGIKRISTSASDLLEKVPEEEEMIVEEEQEEVYSEVTGAMETADEQEIEGDVDLRDELAMSGDDADAEDEEEGEWDSSMLLASNMQAQGQIVADLALSDSDDEQHLEDIRRPERDDDDLDTF